MKRNQTGISLQNYTRLLPKLNCPLCGNELMKPRMNGYAGGDIEISWVCDCDKFIELKLYANTNKR